MTAFISRHEYLKTRPGTSIPRSCAKFSNQMNIKKCIESLETVFGVYEFEQSNTYNFDETGAQIGLSENLRYVTLAFKWRVWRSGSDNRQNVSIIECISVSENC